MKRKGRRKRRGNPELLTLFRNPAKRDAELQRAIAASTKFHGSRPRKVRQVPGSGPPLVVLGDLREIVYQPARGARRGPAFVHKFARGARLAATADGKHLFLVPAVGKPFRVDWDRGIIG